MWNYIKSHLNDLVVEYRREFSYVIHDGGIILFFFFLPLVYPVLYSLIYNPEVVRDVKMVVVDHDRTALSRELVRKMDACQEVWVTGYATDLNEARHAMNSHKCYGILEIPEGFSRKLGRGDQAPVAMYCEMSLLLRYKAFLTAATSVAQDMGANLLSQKLDRTIPIAETISTGDPLPIENVSMGNIENGFDSFVMPGVIVLILHQCIILASGMAGGARRENPMLIGYNAAGRPRSVAAAMAGEMLCYITILIVPIFFLLHYVPLIFAFPMAGNLLEMLAFITPMVLACFGLSFCFQAVVWERESVFVLWVATSIIFLFISGLTWPRYAMPEVWKVIGDLIPGTWGVEGFIRMNTNGASLAQVRTPYLWLWGLAGGYLVLGYCVRRWVILPTLWRRRQKRLAAAAAEFPAAS